MTSTTQARAERRALTPEQQLRSSQIDGLLQLLEALQLDSELPFPTGITTALMPGDLTDQQASDILKHAALTYHDTPHLDPEIDIWSSPESGSITLHFGPIRYQLTRVWHSLDPS